MPVLHLQVSKNNFNNYPNFHPAIGGHRREDGGREDLPDPGAAENVRVSSWEDLHRRGGYISDGAP